MRTTYIAYIASAVVLFSASSLSAQQTSASPQPDGPLVKLSVIAIDSKNGAVDKIQKSDLRVVEDKLEQAVISFEADERPADIAIALDASGSFEGLLPYALEAAKMIVNSRKASDEIFIETFISSDQVETVQDFTTDSAALIAAVSRLKIRMGQSAIIDAIYLATKHLAEHKAGEDRRKALIIITDGEERNSYYTQPDLTKILQETGVPVFVLAITTKLNNESGLIRKSPRERAEKFLNGLAAETGGRVFFSQTPKELSDSTSEVIRNLQTSFLLTYRSSNTSTRKGFRKVSVKATSTGGTRRTIIASPGYFFTRSQSVSNSKPLSKQP